ncbi:putative reverse transcriptase domain, viral movement protein [Tanacetum coccineum]
MNPDHYQLAKEECEQLVSQGIIEPTTSPWACEAFYVNKRSEQVRGKLRLNSLVLSKFDLKSGWFWQLGIKPEDRPKIAFCIPDHHYQWKVMPFGLKNAPSAFQKAMITIFEPILANTLVYIDDILLFSPDEQSHAELLSKFYSLVAKYGIMLSEKKMEVGVTTIQFLGMEISDGKYQPQPHVAQELLKFPDELSSQKMIQQFLGLVNYMADFLPKLSHHTALLFPMLKKNPPQWTSRQTEAVKAIKCLAEKMPPLKIPASSEKRILQTDASDECWGAVYLHKSLMAKANGVDKPDKIPYYVMWNISVWNKDHPDAYKWIEANGQWLYDNFDHCDVETSDDDDDARSLWSSDDDEHFDPFEDDPTHPDARWSP